MKTSKKDFSRDKSDTEIYNFKCHNCGNQIAATYKKSEEKDSCEFCGNKFDSTSRDDI